MATEESYVKAVVKQAIDDTTTYWFGSDGYNEDDTLWSWIFLTGKAESRFTMAHSHPSVIPAAPIRIKIDARLDKSTAIALLDRLVTHIKEGDSELLGYNPDRQLKF